MERRLRRGHSRIQHGRLTKAPQLTEPVRPSKVAFRAEAYKWRENEALTSGLFSRNYWTGVLLGKGHKKTKEEHPMMKILTVAALSLGLATSAMAQGASGGSGGDGSNSGSANSGNSGASGGNAGGNANGGNASGADSSKSEGSSQSNCGAPGGTQGAAQAGKPDTLSGSSNPGAGAVGTSC